MNHSPTASSPVFNLISDDESLEDHSIEDFKGVKLEIKENVVVEEGANSNSGITSHRDNLNLSLNGPSTSTCGSGSGSGDNDNPAGISITPMPMTMTLHSHSSKSNTLSPSDCHETISLGSPLLCGESPLPPRGELEARDFFSYRDILVKNCIEELEKLVDSFIDGDLRGMWILTEIDYWDNEKERVILLCEKTIIIVNYDFIGMKKIEDRRIDIPMIDKIIIGLLKYPDRSITPRLNGLAGGLGGIIRNSIIPKVSNTVQSVGSAVLYKVRKSNSSSNLGENNQNPKNGKSRSQSTSNTNDKEESEGNSRTSILSALSVEAFTPKTRNIHGVRLMWNQDQDLSFTQKWNPFNNSIPWTTFSSHPLFSGSCDGHNGTSGSGINFDIESFSRELNDILREGYRGCMDLSPICRIEYKPIIVENYIGLTSLVHNNLELGFYKVRGKVSF